MSGHNPTNPELISRGIVSRMRDIWTSTQGVVTAYDAEKQRADVQLVAPDVTPSESKGFILEPLPILPEVPVLFPGGGGFKLHWPLNAGDEVLILCTRQSLRAWYATGKVGGDPGDVGQHSLANALAIPILGRVTPTVDPDGAAVLECALVKIGDPSTADFAALASKVDTALSHLVAALSDASPSGVWAAVETIQPGSAALLGAAFAAAFVPTLPGPPGPHPIDPTPCTRVKIT